MNIHYIIVLSGFFTFGFSAPNQLPTIVRDKCIDTRLEDAIALADDYRYTEAAKKLELYLNNIDLIHSDNQDCVKQGQLMLAAIWFRLERFNESKELLAKVMESICGKEPKTCLVRRQALLLMSWLEHAEGNLDNAVRYANEVLAGIEGPMVGDDLMASVRAYDELADIMNDIGEYQKAMDYMMRSVTPDTKQNDAAMHIIRSRFAITLLEMKKVDDAGAVLGAVDREMKSRLSDNHKLQLEILSAVVSKAQGKKMESRKAIEKTIEHILKRKGENSGMLIDPLELLAMIKVEDGEYDGAYAHLQHAKRIATAIFGTEHSRISGIDMGMSSIAYNRGMKKEAIGILTAAKERIEKRLGARSPKLVPILENMANVLYVYGDLESAYQVLTQLREIQNHMFGPENQKTRSTEGKIRWTEKELEKQKNSNTSSEGRPRE